jgi:hypothetical protein
MPLTGEEEGLEAVELNGIAKSIEPILIEVKDVPLEQTFLGGEALDNLSAKRTFLAWLFFSDSYVETLTEPWTSAILLLLPIIFSHVPNEEHHCSIDGSRC